MSDILKIAVLGAGSWGTALAAQMARNGHAVTLWGRDPRQIAELREHRSNERYLPGIPLPDSLCCSDDLRHSVLCAELRQPELAVTLLEELLRNGPEAALKEKARKVLSRLKSD